MKLTIYLFIILLTFFAITECVTESTQFKSGVSDHIKRLRPDFSDKKVTVLASKIKQSATKHGVNRKLLVAILMQESRLTHGVKGKRRGKVIDLGIAQINVKTAKAYKLDKKRLVNDLGYAIDSGAYILAEKQRIYGTWTAYHSNNAKNAARYEKLVKRYL